MITVNLDKAKDITKDRLRADRKPLLEEQDVLKRAEFLHSFLKMKIDLIHRSKMRSTHDPRWN